MKMREVKRIVQAAEPNLLDRAIAYVDPVRAARRHRARMVMAMAGAYKGASRDEGWSLLWKTSEGSADSDIQYDLPKLRERSRDLCRNNAIAAGAIKTKVTNVVGTGLRPSAAVDWEALGITQDQATEIDKLMDREWNLFAKRPCDVEQRQSFGEVLRLAYEASKQSGDSLVVFTDVRRMDSPYSLALQVLEGDYLSNPNDNPDTELTRGGVQYDERGTVVGYHVRQEHPGNQYVGSSAYEWTFLNARDSLGNVATVHLYDKTRPGQSRGVPDLAPVVEVLKQLGRWTEAEIYAAVVNSMFAVFVETEGGLGAGGGPFADMGTNPGTSTKQTGYQMEGGASITLAPGEKIEVADPKRPNANADTFVTMVMRQVGMALEIPFEVLVKHFQASYSAARGSLNEMWKFVTKEREWLTRQLCEPTYAQLMTEAALRGRIPAMGLIGGDPAARAAWLNAEWYGPARGQIDETKEVKAAADRIKAKLSTHSRETVALIGEDWRRVVEKQGQEREALEEAGLGAPAQLEDQSQPGSGDGEGEDDQPQPPTDDQPEE